MIRTPANQLGGSRGKTYPTMVATASATAFALPAFAVIAGLAALPDAEGNNRRYTYFP